MRPIFLVERTRAERSFDDRVLLVGGGKVRGSGGGYVCDAITMGIKYDVLQMVVGARLYVVRTKCRQGSVVSDKRDSRTQQMREESL